MKTAAMCEEVAHTVHVARQGGPIVPIDPADIDSLYRRYQNAYGQQLSEQTTQHIPDENGTSRA